MSYKMELSFLKDIHEVDMATSILFTDPDIPDQPRRELLQRSPWAKLQERRARAHRAFCVQAANRVIDELRHAGVEAVIFGSLTGDPKVFRSDSDVDLCLLKKAGMQLVEIEDVVRKYLGSVKYDLVEFGDMASGVRNEVVANGVPHVQ